MTPQEKARDTVTKLTDALEAKLIQEIPGPANSQLLYYQVGKRVVIFCINGFGWDYFVSGKEIRTADVLLELKGLL